MPVPLLDVSGQRVMDLKVGADDVRALAPGVYFVLEEPQAASPKLQATGKVVVARKGTGGSVVQTIRQIVQQAIHRIAPRILCSIARRIAVRAIY